MKDRIIAVTGAAGVLGRAVVAALDAAGAVVVAIDVNTCAAPGARLTISGVDLSEKEAAARAVDWILKDLGRLDGLVNLAGGFAWETVLEGRLETWQNLFNINLATALVMSQAAAHALISSKGAIVNVGAAAATRAALGMGAYAASKAGVARLTEAFAEELKDQDVRVNAVLPSILDTPANRADMGDADAHRWVKPEALAEVIVFLLSDAADAITGATLPVTGRV